MTTGKTIALTRRTHVVKTNSVLQVGSLVLDILSLRCWVGSWVYESGGQKGGLGVVNFEVTLEVMGLENAFT